MRLTCEGEDNLGKFTIYVPDKCQVCEKESEVGLYYRSKDSRMNLKSLGIEAEDTILYTARGTLGKGRGSLKHIGITCGCYAKLQRQIAHIRDKKKKRE